MKKSSIIILIFYIIISTIVLCFGKNISKYFYNRYFSVNENDYLYGSGSGEHGKISLKLRVDNTGSIKEVSILEHPDNDISSAALQKLIMASIDKESIDEIDAISGATETTDIYKKILDDLLDVNYVSETQEVKEKVSLTDSEILSSIERNSVNQEGFKSGVGGYVMNQFQDADYNKNGNLVTHEYICAVLLNQYNRIEDVRFDHIASNISFTKKGEVPTGGARAYTFLSDKSKSGFNGLVNDGNYIDIFDFEDKVLTLRHFEDVRGRYGSKKEYQPLVNALENAIDNARYVGANSGDTLGLSASKVLKKRDIKDSTDEENGYVKFTSNYCVITTDKAGNISSSMFDNVENNVTLTNLGKILGSREKEIYTLNELSNPEKYSKIEKDRYNLKIQLNYLADFLRGNSIDSILGIISKSTDNKGIGKEGSVFANIKSIDFIEFIDIISKAYVDAVKIRA